MKASELNKENEPIENIYNGISAANSRGQFKFLIPHFIYVTDAVKLQLIEDGFKISFGNWNAYDYGLIIEW